MKEEISLEEIVFTKPRDVWPIGFVSWFIENFGEDFRKKHKSKDVYVKIEEHYSRNHPYYKWMESKGFYPTS